MRNEIFVLEKISLDYEYVDRIYCDSIKYLGKWNDLEKNVNVEENIDDGSKSLVFGCIFEIINK